MARQAKLRGPLLSRIFSSSPFLPVAREPFRTTPLTTDTTRRISFFRKDRPHGLVEWGCVFRTRRTFPRCPVGEDVGLVGQTFLSALSARQTGMSAQQADALRWSQRGGDTC